MMHVKVYQANIEWKNKFMGYDFVMSHGGIDQSEYNCVYDGYVETNNLEDIFIIFNTSKVYGFTGHSLSVSDIIVVEGLGIYFVDTFGFAEIFDFKSDK